MTIKDYFQAKFQIIGIPIDLNQADNLIIAQGIDSAKEFSAETKPDTDKVFLNIVFDMLARPNISEDDFSISYNKDALITWYKAEAKRLGVEDLISGINCEVQDMSHLA